MGQFALMAIRAFRGDGGSQKIMGAALRGALLGVAAFRIRHDTFLSTSMRTSLGIADRVFSQIEAAHAF